MKLNIDNNIFEVNVDLINVTPIEERNPNWTHTCEGCGRTHKYHKGDDNYPTLNLVIDQMGTEDYPSLTHYECMLCGERIEPDYRVPMGERYVKGQPEYFINNNKVSKKEFKRRLNKK